jgi:hypothetical protein
LVGCLVDYRLQKAICGYIYPMLFNMSAVHLTSVGNNPNHSSVPPAALHATLVTRIFFNQKNRSHSSPVRWNSYVMGSGIVWAMAQECGDSAAGGTVG